MSAYEHLKPYLEKITQVYEQEYPLDKITHKEYKDTINFYRYNKGKKAGFIRKAAYKTGIGVEHLIEMDVRSDERQVYTTIRSKECNMQITELTSRNIIPGWRLYS